MLAQRLLAADVRRRPRRSGASAHHQRPSSPDHRRDAGGVPLRRRARPRPAAADQPRTADTRSSGSLGVARLKPGVTLAQANADAARILQVWFDNSGVRTGGPSAVGAVAAAPQAGRRRRCRQDALGPDGNDRRSCCSWHAPTSRTCCWCVRTHGSQEFAIRAALGARWTRSRAPAARREPDARAAGRRTGRRRSPTAACACWWRSGLRICPGWPRSRSTRWSSVSRWRSR